MLFASGYPKACSLLIAYITGRVPKNLICIYRIFPAQKVVKCKVERLRFEVRHVVSTPEEFQPITCRQALPHQKKHPHFPSLPSTGSIRLHPLNIETPLTSCGSISNLTCRRDGFLRHLLRFLQLDRLPRGARRGAPRRGE